MDGDHRQRVGWLPQHLQLARADNFIVFIAIIDLFSVSGFRCLLSMMCQTSASVQ